MAYDSMNMIEQSPPATWTKKIRGGKTFINVAAGTNIKLTIGTDTVLSQTIPTGKKANITLNFDATLFSA